MEGIRSLSGQVNGLQVSEEHTGACNCIVSYGYYVRKQ